MRRQVDHRAMCVAGYPDPWCAQAGTTVRLHLSSSAPIDEARVVSLDGGDVAADWTVTTLEAAPGPGIIEAGSFLRVRGGDLEGFGPVDHLSVEIFLTDNPEARTLLRVGDLRLDLEGEHLRVVQGNRPILGPLAVPRSAWLRLRLGREGMGTAIEIDGGDRLAPTRLRLASPAPWPGPQGPFLLGSGGPEERSANARFARPVLGFAERSLSWRFPTLLPPDMAVRSDGPEAVPMEVVNLPAFCLCSPRWDGTSFDPRLVPDHYDALHVHEDDMGPCGWPATHEIQVPADAAPGVYALEARTSEGAERIPFFVRGRRRAAPLLVVLPTATYLAYLGEALPPHLYPWVGDDRGHRFARDNGLLSLYDFHRDLSGVSIVSMRKPMATLRDDYTYPLCGCPHNLPVDLRLLRFLRANGVAFDLLTDHDLHAEGLAALEGYAAVATGSHPEYLSVEMESAIAAFLAGGGSLAYLGGNGFAAAVAFRDDLMELRRGPMETGRTWDGPVSEQALALTNEPGGFLRHRGKGEFSLVGGAISLMGFEGARPFRRTEASRDPACAWLFEGVEGELFGQTGTVLGAAAGYEVDATDPRLGTHPDTIVVARAEGFPEGFVADASRWYPGGEPEAKGRRVAAMTLRWLPAGGIVFSASSVAWCGALPEPGAMNDVGRITLNILSRACAPRGETDRSGDAETHKNGRRP